MPIYEYNCPKCGDFDQMQKITDGPLKKCPTCKAKVTKLISNPAFHLKGGGWYITDYGRKDGGGGGKDGGGGGASESKSSEESSSSSSSTETKAEKKDKKSEKKASAAA